MIVQRNFFANTMSADRYAQFCSSLGTEELAHIEIVSTILCQLTRNMTIEQIKAAGFEAYFVDHTAGVYPQCACGMPFSASTLQSTGDVFADLNEDLAADATTV